jgi:hypothetical protein
MWGVGVVLGDFVCRMEEEVLSIVAPGDYD